MSILRHPGRDHKPKLDGNDVDLLEYQHCLIAGFTRMYRLLLSRSEEFTHITPLARLASDEIRYPVRLSYFYSRLLNESSTLDLLRDALERDCYRFDRIFWQVVNVSLISQGWLGLNASDLLVGDIPILYYAP